LIKKIDVVMWTKNGERFLPLVLKRVDEGIPSEYVDKKILVDDSSTDRTVAIALTKLFRNMVFNFITGGVFLVVIRYGLA